MSETLDHIKQEFDTPMGESDDGASVEADWDAEIDARVRQVEEGEVELVSADGAVERVRAKLTARRAELTTAA